MVKCGVLGIELVFLMFLGIGQITAETVAKGNGRATSKAEERQFLVRCALTCGMRQLMRGDTNFLTRITPQYPKYDVPDASFSIS
jgi:hypothetical protein